MKKVFFQRSCLLLATAFSLSLLCMNACTQKKAEDSSSMSQPDVTGSLSDTSMDAIDPRINPAGAAEDSLSGKINGSTSGNNTGRTE